MKRVLIFLFVLVFLTSSVLAETTVLSGIGATSDQATLGYPRWKMFMSPNDYNKTWITVSTPHDQIFHTIDGGQTWTGFSDTASNTYSSIYGGELTPYEDMHLALTGDNSENLFTIGPGYGTTDLAYVPILSPATSTADIEPITSISVDPGISKRANLVATDNYVFLITRTSSNAVGNVRYLRYDKNNNYVDQGWVIQSPSTNVRVGSTLYQGNPLVVIWNGDPPFDIRYYLWNGNSFNAPVDSLITEYGDSTGCDRDLRTREYSFTVAGDNLHVVWACTPTTVMHAYKQIGTAGSWNYQEIVNNPQQSYWFMTPILTSFGNDVFVFYTLEHNSNPDSSDIYYKRWNSTAQTWGTQTAVTTDSNNNANPNTVPIVNPDSDYIPVIWLRGTSPYTLLSERIPVTPGQEPPVQNTPDVNNDGNINVIDLALAVFWQGKNSGDADWSNYLHLDVNNDGSNINWQDVLEIIGVM